MPVDTRRSPHAHWRTLPLDMVSLSRGFWASKQLTNLERSLAHGYRMLEQAGNLHNLRLAAGQAEGEFKGPVFQDSDVYKWLEAVGYQATLGQGLTAELRARADEAIELIRSAQASDGYLDSYYQVVAPDRRWSNVPHGHELYCAGHLIQAALAHQRCAGDGRLLEVARRLVEHIRSVFGPDKRAVTPGHPEIEMALVELYRHTGEDRYLDLATFFIDQRGRGLLGPSALGGLAYYQDRVPVRESTEVEGHAVRALYLACGVADVYLETGEPSLFEALDRQWHDLVAHKLSLTGGAGARYDGEAFGRPYELPNETAYNETCAAIASIMWNWRMLLASGEARYADLIEWTLYNGFLSGVSLDGERFYYINPLLSRGESGGGGRRARDRQPWYRVACCPPNVMRLLASLAHYFASASPAGLQVHQYGSGRIEADLTADRRVGIAVETDFPWDDCIAITVTCTDAEPWELSLRRPGWCAAPSLSVAGDQVDDVGAAGYISIRRVWQAGERIELRLPMPPRLMEANPRLESVQDCVAIARGPVVYCIEQCDTPTGSALEVQIDPSAELEASWQADLLGGVCTVSAYGLRRASEPWSDAAVLYRPLANGSSARPQPLSLTAVPYYAWANREPGAMRVWIPRTT